MRSQRPRAIHGHDLGRASRHGCAAPANAVCPSCYELAYGPEQHPNHAVVVRRQTERSAMVASTETREHLIKRLEDEARQIRANVWRACRASGTGHMGGPLSA